MAKSMNTNITARAMSNQLSIACIYIFKSEFYYLISYSQAIRKTMQTLRFSYNNHTIFMIECVAYIYSSIYQNSDLSSFHSREIRHLLVSRFGQTYVLLLLFVGLFDVFLHLHHIAWFILVATQGLDPYLCKFSVDIHFPFEHRFGSFELLRADFHMIHIELSFIEFIYLWEDDVLCFFNI